MWPNPQETADLVTFTEKIFNGELHFLCSERGGWESRFSLPRKVISKRKLVFLDKNKVTGKVVVFL